MCGVRSVATRTRDFWSRDFEIWGGGGTGMVSGLGVGLGVWSVRNLRFLRLGHPAISHRIYCVPQRGQQRFFTDVIPPNNGGSSSGGCLKDLRNEGRLGPPFIKQGCQTQGNVRLWPCCDSEIGQMRLL